MHLILHVCSLWRLCLELERQALFQMLENSISICLCPSLLPPVAHQQPRNDFNRDGGERN